MSTLIKSLCFNFSILNSFTSVAREAPIKVEGAGGAALEPETVTDALDDIVARLPIDVLNESRELTGRALVETGVVRKRS